MRKMTNLLFFILIPIFLTNVAIAQVQITIVSDKDNTLYESSTGALSNGAGIHFFAGRISTMGSGLIRRGLISFDIAGNVNPGATIDSVILTLTMTKTSSGAQDITLHRLSADWGEGTSDAGSQRDGAGEAAATGDATWIHTFFNTVNWTSAGGDFSSTVSATQSVDATGSYSWGSTSGMVSEVQGWLDDPVGNFGWAIVGNESTLQTTKAFGTHEINSAASRPSLQIFFTPLPNVPPELINTIPDAIADEDFGTLTVARLDTIFDDPDLPFDNLTYTVLISSEVISSSTSGGLMKLLSVADMSGMAEVVVIATDDSSVSISDTFNVSVEAVNDPPMFVDFPDSIFLDFGQSATLILSDFVIDVDDPDSLLIWPENICLGDPNLTCVSTNADTMTINPGNDVSGPLKFDFRVADTSGASDTASVIIYVMGSVGIDGDLSGVPMEYALSQNYPNPFNPQTVIEYSLPVQSEVNLIVYDLRGQEVAHLINNNMPAGNHRVSWNASSLASGVYLYRLQAGDFTQTRKMLLLK